jgi:hypothetical protein
VLAVFSGERRGDRALSAAISILRFAQSALRDSVAAAASRAGSAYSFSVGVGIDDGDIFRICVETPKNNAVLWTGAANTAAKLAKRRTPTGSLTITREALEALADPAFADVAKLSAETVTLIGKTRFVRTLLVEDAGSLRPTRAGKFSAECHATPLGAGGPQVGLRSTGVG